MHALSVEKEKQFEFVPKNTVSIESPNAGDPSFVLAFFAPFESPGFDNNGVSKGTRATTRTNEERMKNESHEHDWAHDSQLARLGARSGYANPWAVAVLLRATLDGKIDRVWTVQARGDNDDEDDKEEHATEEEEEEEEGDTEEEEEEEDDDEEEE